MRLLGSRSSFAVLLALLALGVVPATANALATGAQFGGKFPSYDPAPAEQVRELDRMRGQGATVVRHHIAWTRLAAGCSGQSVEALGDHSNPCYDWRVLDNAVRLSGERGMRVLLTLSGVPIWLHGSEDPYYVGASNAEFARFVGHYAAVLRATATRYSAGSSRGRVRLWTVWQESNSSVYFRGVERSQMGRQYARLYAKSAVALKSVDATNLVAAGPTNPTGGIGVRPLVFVSQVQRHLPSFLPGIHGERRFIDAWAHHPYSLKGPFAAPSPAWVIGMSNLPALLNRLDDDPLTRGLPLWVTEYGWQTRPEDRVLGVPRATQGRYMAEALDFLDGLGRVPLAISLGVTDPKDTLDWQSGTYTADGRAKASVGWVRRPVSVRTSVVRRGATVRVWARSSVRPTRTRIAFSVAGAPWRLIPGTTPRADGVVIARVRVTRSTRFAAYDGLRGPARAVVVS